MDILKELFGTSDELQISKSLFGSDASSTPVDLGLDHPGPLSSPSRDYLSNRPLPLLQVGVEPRNHNTVTSSLIRSHSLDNLHGSANNDDNIFSRPDPSRAQSVFPQLSQVGTANHVDLQNVPPEMPMYLLEDDEGNDEEIMRLLETPSNHSGRTSVVSGSSPNGSCGRTSTGSGSLSVSIDTAAIETVAMEIVAMESEDNDMALSETSSVSLATTTSEEIAMATNTSTASSITSSCSTKLIGSNVVSMAITDRCHAYQGRRHSLSPQRQVNNCSTPILPSSLPVSPVAIPSIHTPSHLTPPPSNMQLNIDLLREQIRRQGLRLEQALKTLKSSGQSSGQCSGQSSGQSSGQPSGKCSGQPSGKCSGQPSGQYSGQYSGQSSGQCSGQSSGQCSGQCSGQSSGQCSGQSSGQYSGQCSGQCSEPMLATTPVNPTVSVTMTTNSTITSYPSLKNTGLQNGIETTTTTWPEINTTELVWNTDHPERTNYPSIKNTGFKTITSPHTCTSSCSSDAQLPPVTMCSELPTVTMCSVAIQAGNGLQGCDPQSVTMDTKQATPPNQIISDTPLDTCETSSNHDDNNLSNKSRDNNHESIVSEERNVVMCGGDNKEGKEGERDIDVDGCTNNIEQDNDKEGGVNIPPVATGNNKECDIKIDTTPSDDVAVTTNSDSTQNTVTMTTVTTATVDMTATSIHNIHPLKQTSPMSAFCSTFSVHIPDMNWRVQPFRSILGMRALPITILPPSPSTHSHITPSHTSQPNNLSDTSIQTPLRKKRRRNGGGWPKGKKRKIIESGIPKPPSTAYSLFLSDKRQSMADKATSMTMSQLSKIIGKMWSNLPTHIKQEYHDRAVQDRGRYLDELRSHLTKKQKENSSCNLEYVNAVLNKLVTTAEDNSVLVCRLCKLSFTSLHNKHSHLCGRMHTDCLLKEMCRVMSQTQWIDTRSSPGSMSHGMECRQTEVRTNGLDCESTESKEIKVNGVKSDSSTKHRNEVNETNPMECDNEQSSDVDSGMGMGDTGTGPDIEPSHFKSLDINPSLNSPDDQDVQNDDDIPSDNALVQTDDDNIPSDNALVQTDDDNIPSDNAPIQTDDDNIPSDNAPIQTDDDNIPSDNAPIQTDDDNIPSDNAPIQTDDDNSVQISHGNGTESTSLIEWARDYAGLLREIKKINSRFEMLPQSTVVRTGQQTSLLNRLCDQQHNLLQNIESILTILNTLTHNDQIIE